MSYLKKVIEDSLDRVNPYNIYLNGDKYTIARGKVICVLRKGSQFPILNTQELFNITINLYK